MPLVRPPMMATAKALRPSTAPMVAPVSVSGAISTPANAAVSEDSAYENVMTSPVLMPISAAASRSFAVATTALPKIVRRFRYKTIADEPDYLKLVE